MEKLDREPATEPKPRPDCLTRLLEEKRANGGRPNHEAALEALERYKAAVADAQPIGFKSDEEIEDYIDAMGLRKNRIQDWNLVPWSYWEARGAGPYRR